MSDALGELFSDIAGVIRDKTGDTATMKPTEFPEKIDLLSDTSMVTATASDVLGGKVFVDSFGNKVIGTLVGDMSGAGKNIVAYVNDSYTPANNKENTITHGLGVIPDIVLFFSNSTNATAMNMALMMVGFSDTLVNKIGLTYTQRKIYVLSTDKVACSNVTQSITDTATGSHVVVRSANDSSVIVGVGTHLMGGRLDTSKTYSVIIIGGIT